MIFAVTGPIGAGKTTALTRLNAEIRQRGHSTGGVLTARVPQSGTRIGYDLMDLTRGEMQPLAMSREWLTPERERECVPFFNFRFFKKALRDGNQAIASGMDAGVLFIDEVGLWELSGGGWAESLSLLPRRAGPVILGLREGIASELEQTRGISLSGIVTVRDSLESSVEELLHYLNL